MVADSTKPTSPQFIVGASSGPTGDDDTINIQFSPRPRGLRNICDNCVFNAMTQRVASMMAMTGFHCAVDVPGPLGELLQWAATSSASAGCYSLVDDDELFDLIKNVEMVGRQQATLQPVQSMLHQWTVDDLFIVAQEWWSAIITVMPGRADSADQTVAAICYGNSEGLAKPCRCVCGEWDPKQKSSFFYIALARLVLLKFRLLILLHLFYTEPIFLEPRISEVHEITIKTEFLRISNKRTSNIRGSRKISPLYKTSANEIRA